MVGSEVRAVWNQGWRSELGLGPVTGSCERRLASGLGPCLADVCHMSPLAPRVAIPVLPPSTPLSRRGLRSQGAELKVTAGRLGFALVGLTPKAAPTSGASLTVPATGMATAAQGPEVGLPQDFPRTGHPLPQWSGASWQHLLASCQRRVLASRIHPWWHLRPRHLAGRHRP